MLYFIYRMIKGAALSMWPTDEEAKRLLIKQKVDREMAIKDDRK